MKRPVEKSLNRARPRIVAAFLAAVSPLAPVLGVSLSVDGPVVFSYLPISSGQSAPVCMSGSGELGGCEPSSLSPDSRIAWVGNGAGTYDSIWGPFFFFGVWCPSPNADQRCVVKLGPGVHDLGGVQLSIPSYVVLEGQGEGVTIIQSTSTRVLNVSATSGVELRDLTVRTTGGGADRVAIYGDGSITDLKLTRIGASAASSSGDAAAISLTSGSDATLRWVNATAGSDDTNGTVSAILLAQIDSLLEHVDAGVVEGLGENLHAAIRAIGPNMEATIRYSSTHYTAGYPMVGIVSDNAGVWVNFSDIVAGANSNTLEAINGGQIFIRHSELNTSVGGGTIGCTLVTDGSIPYYTTCP